MEVKTVIPTTPPTLQLQGQRQVPKIFDYVKYNLYSHATILGISKTGQVLLPVNNLTVCFYMDQT